MWRLFEGSAYLGAALIQVNTVSLRFLHCEIIIKNSTENRGLVLLSLHWKTEMIDWPFCVKQIWVEGKCQEHGQRP